MSDMSMPTIVETGKNNNDGWGGNAWGAGVGGFIGSLFGNGGFGGWGWGGNRAGQVGADVAIANQLEHVSDQVQQAAISNLQSANGIQQGIAGAAAGVTAGVTQNTIANLQGFAGMGQQLCCSTGRLSQDIDTTGDQITAAIGVNSQMMADRLCGLNQSVITQGYQGQLQTKDVLTQLQGQHADLKATIIEQGCQDREVMREIAAQAVRDKLNECQNELAAQKTQNNLTQQLQNQTLYLIQQLKTTAAAGA